MSYFNRFPFLKFSLPFVFGIILAVLVKFPAKPFWAILVGILTCGSYFLFRFLKRPYLSHSVLLFLITGLSWYYSSSLLYLNSDIPETFFEQPYYYRVQIAEFPKVGAKNIRCKVKILDSDSVLNTNLPELALVSFEKDSNSLKLTYSDILWIKTQWQIPSPAPNPNAFDYARYLRFQNLHVSTYLRGHQWVFIKNETLNPILKQAHYWRKHCIQIFQDLGFKEDVLAVISAILLGAEDFLTPDLRQQYADAGVVHILSVSGMHLAIIFVVFEKLLSFLNRRKTLRTVKAFLLLIVIWFYATLTGLASPTVRAAAMFTFVLGGGLLQRQTSIYYSLGASLIFLLIYNPLFFFNLGFQLSYLAIFGIAALQSYLSELITSKSKIVRYVWDILTVSFAAQLFTAPLAVYYFHLFPNYFLLSNLSLMLISTVVLIGGIVVLAFSWIPVLSAFLSYLLISVTGLMNFIINYISNLPYAVTDRIYINLVETFCIYILIIAVCVVIFHKNKKAVFIGMLAIVAFFSSQLIRKHQIQNNSEMIIYSSKIPAVQFREGKTSVVFSDTTAISECEPYNIAHGLSPVFKFSDSIEAFQFNEKSILHLRNKIKLSEKCKVDILWISHNAKIRLEDFETGLVILDATNSYYYSSQKVQECQKNGISVYSVREKGAFRLKE